MSRHLFIKGYSQIGKSTLLLDCIRDYKKDCGGFLSQRLLDKEGVTMGFRLISIEEASSTSCRYNPTLPNIFLEKTANGWIKNEDVFRTYGVELLKKSKDKTLIIMDEIGGMEIYVPEFKAAVYELLDSNKSCIGILKSQRNYKAMGKEIGSNSDIDNLREQLALDMVNKFNVEIFDYSIEKKSEGIEKMQEFIKASFQRKKRC